MLNEPAFHIIVFSAIFASTWIYIWKRDVLFSGVYLFLYVYTIFAQVGYAYFPELSILIRAYFGEELFFELNQFVTLSFLSYFACFFFLHRRVTEGVAYRVTTATSTYRWLFYLLLAVHLSFLSVYFAAHFDSLTYSSFSDEDFAAQMGAAYTAFALAYKFSVVLCALLYVLYRVRTEDAPPIPRRPVLIALILEGSLFLSIAFKIGSRTDPFALMLAILVLEVTLHREGRGRAAPNWRRWAALGGASALALVAIVQLENLRSPDRGSRDSVAEEVLFKDYYAPSHILIAAMAYDYVDPWEVATSNVANSLVLLNHPYLQVTVADLFNPGASTRSSSYAFYLFSEGFLVWGRWGFLYNGLVAFLGVALWRLLSRSGNQYYNLVALAVVSTQLANIARSQSSYFIKDLYMIFGPAMFVFFLATGIRPELSAVAGASDLGTAPALEHRPGEDSSLNSQSSGDDDGDRPTRTA